MMPDSLNSSQRSFPSRVRSPTPAKTEIPPWCFAMLWISSWMSTVLPTPAPPKRPVLPPFVYGSRRSTTLMPVSSICDRGRLVLERRRRPVDGVGLVAGHRAELVHGLADDVQDSPERALPHRHRDGPPGVLDLGAPGEAVRGRHRDRPHGRLAEVLGHLQHELLAVGEDVLGLEARDLERVVDRGQDAGLELHVDDRPDHLDDTPFSHAPSPLPLLSLARWPAGPRRPRRCRGAPW